MTIPNLPDIPAPERVNVYMDGSNLYHSLRQRIGRSDLDFLAFARKLAGGRRLHRIYYYSVPLDQGRTPEAYRAQQQFFEHLRRTDYLELRLGRLVYGDDPGAPPREKGVDIMLATDMVSQGIRGHYDVAILVSADTDFCHALQLVKDFGRHAEVALFNPSASMSLRHVADRTILVDQAFLSDCWLK